MAGFGGSDMRCAVFAAILGSVLLAAGPALAIPLTWYVNGTFADGGVINGSFTYDADTNTYSAVSVSVTGGSLSNAIYVTPNTPFVGPVQLSAVTASGTGSGERLANFIFSAPLTNAGGLVLLGPTTAEGTCNVGCNDFTGGVPDRVVSPGGLLTTTAPIPTMGEWAMIGLIIALAALGGLIVTRRRRLA